MSLKLYKWGVEQIPPTEFIFEITTDDSTKTYTMVLDAGGTYDFTIDWGDGSGVDTITAYDDADLVHEFPSLETAYTVTMVGSCDILDFSSSPQVLWITKLLDVADLGFTQLSFNGCEYLTEISPNLCRLKSLTTAASMFASCWGLTSIPEGIFDGSTGITTFSLCFAWNSITNLPEDLFRYQQSLGGNPFEYAFAGMQITTIPANLLKWSGTQIDYLDGTFAYCESLTTVPTDLFRYNTAIVASWSTFEGCVGLETVSANLFKYNTSCIAFIYTFLDCNKLQLNANIFYADGEQDTRFLNQDVDFTGCFYRSSFTGTQGEAPDLWTCDFGTGSATSTDTFAGAGNDAESISNFAGIPDGWKGL